MREAGKVGKAGEIGSGRQKVERQRAEDCDASSLIATLTASALIVFSRERLHGASL